MSISNIIENWQKGIKDDLTKNYIRLGLKASGNWPNELEEYQQLSASNIVVGMLGASYTEQLENGREPNRNQTKEALKAWVGWAGSTFLAKWVKDKGVDISPYAVAWKIAREGWKVPNRFNAGGLVSDVVNSEKFEELNRSLTLFYVDNIKSDFLKEFKK